MQTAEHVIADGEIVEMYLARNEDAIERTSEKYGKYCSSIAYNILADLFETEECVNDTWMRTWNSIPPTVPRILSAFLGRITRNLALDRYSARSAQKRGGRIAESLDELSECVGVDDVCAELEARELAEHISAFLRGEPEVSRCVFIRRYFHQASVEEIAKKYGLTQANVKVTLHRMRKKLALHLQKEGILV